MTPTQGGDLIKGRSAQKLVYVLEQPEPTGAIDWIDLGHAVLVIWRRRWWIIGLTALATSVAIMYALLATQWYRAEVVLMPRESKAGLGLTAQLAQFGSLADLAGINIGSSGKQEPMGVLRSKGFVRRFIEQNGLRDIIADQLSAGPMGGFPTSIASRDIRVVVDTFARSVMSVSEDKKSGLVTVAVVWPDPKIAASWANALASQLNSELRLRALRESEQNISYLRDQLATTDAVSLQQSIARLLEFEMQKVMLAKGTDEYSFRVIDAAEPPAKRVKPNRVMIVALVFLVGVFISAAGALLVDSLRRAVGAARGA